MDYYATDQDNVDTALHLGNPDRKPGLILLSLWAPSAGGLLDLRRRELKVPGHSWREEIGGWGVLSLQLGDLTPDELRPSHLAVNSERRAHTWADTYTNLGPADAWDWTEVAMRRISGWIRRQGIDKDAGRPILGGAAEARRAGTPFRNH